MNIILFEDGNHENFYPLSLMRPVWELRTGIFSLRERWERFLRSQHKGSETIWYFTRAHIAPLYRERYPDLKINDTAILEREGEVLCVNCAVLPSESLVAVNSGTLIARNSIPLAARVNTAVLRKDGDISASLINAGGLTPRSDDSLQVFEYIWDLVDGNGPMIKSDFSMMDPGAANSPGPGVTIIGEKDQLFMEESVRIDPLACIDLTGGPVAIGKGAVIHSFSRIEGPCAIGRDSIILGARLRGGCGIGDVCRIGGEVEQSIFQGYSSKYHDGFFGHSYAGEWINLGALTTNSDLKNNYAPVKVGLPGKRVATGKLKVGCFIGDFTRTSIGTLINTGSTIGAGCMIVHSGEMAPRFMPSFSWFMGNYLTEGEPLEASLEVCAAMTGRRGVGFSKKFGELLRVVHEESAESRKAEVRKWRDQRR